jgi:1-deoxy-D-xylulose-5-phosphate synthase
VELDTKLREIPIGKWEILREGNDLDIIAIGSMVAPALEAAEILAERQIEASVVNARFAKPLDTEMLTDLCQRIKRIITIEENTLTGGFGASVALSLHELEINDVELKSLGIPDEFVEQGPPAILRASYGLDAKGIVRQALTLVPNHALTRNSLSF